MQVPFFLPRLSSQNNACGATGRPPASCPATDLPCSSLLRPPHITIFGARARIVYPVHAYRPVRPPASRDAQAHCLCTTRFSMRSCSSCLPSPARPTMKLLPVHIHRRPTPPHIRQHKGYIHASPATGTTDVSSGHGPSLCPLPHHGCLLSRTPHGVAG